MPTSKKHDICALQRALHNSILNDLIELDREDIRLLLPGGSQGLSYGWGSDEELIQAVEEVKDKLAEERLRR